MADDLPKNKTSDQPQNPSDNQVNATNAFNAASLWNDVVKITTAQKSDAKLPGGFAEASNLLPLPERETGKGSLQKTEALPELREIPAVKKIVDSADPVGALSSGLDKLSNVRSVELSRREGGWQHVEAKLENSTTGDAPNIRVGRHRPVASHLGQDISFDLNKSAEGIRLTNMHGFTTDVQGPRGRIRTSHTNEMTLGHDQNGAFLRSTASTQGLLKMRTNTVTLRENDFNQGSPMRALMNQPEALKKVGDAMHLFQNTEDVQNLSMKKKAPGHFDVSSEALKARHIDINKKLEGSAATVSSIDLDKSVSASIKHGKDSVSMENIKGIKVNLQNDLFGLKTNMTITPSKISLEKGPDGQPAVKLELTIPGAAPTQFTVPMSKLRGEQKKAG